VVIVALTLFYTFEGGMTAVIWTDVIQMVLYISGAILSLGTILGQLPGGWAQVTALAVPAGKFQIFELFVRAHAGLVLRTLHLLAGVVGGCFLTTASHGTEQLMVQRLLAARNIRDSARRCSRVGPSSAFCSLCS